MYYLKYEHTETHKIITIPCQVIRNKTPYEVWYGVYDENDNLLGDGADNTDEAIQNAIYGGKPKTWKSTETVYHGFYLTKN